MALKNNLETPGFGLVKMIVDAVNETLPADARYNDSGIRIVKQPSIIDDNGNLVPQPSKTENIRDTLIYKALVKFIDYFIKHNEIDLGMQHSGLLSSTMATVNLLAVDPVTHIALPTPFVVNIPQLILRVMSNPLIGGPIK